MKNLFIFVLLMFVCLINSCSKSAEISPSKCDSFPTNTNTYSGGVKKIINESCATSGCHDTKSRADGLILDTYISAKESFVNGRSICSIEHSKGCDAMPDDGSKLSDNLILQLKCWVQNGAPE
jgi:hypothetical protein